MRICLDARYYVSSGASSYIHELMKHMLRMIQEHDYILVKYSHQRFENETAFAHVISVPPGPRILQVLWVFVVLPFKLSQLKVDIYHPLKMAGCFWNPSKTVVTMHSITSDYQGTFPVSWYSRVYNTVYADPSLGKSGRLVAVSTFVRNCLVEAHEIPSERIDVIYHGIDTKFRPMEGKEFEPILREYGLKSGYLLCVGNIFPVKNHLTAVRAFKEIAGEFDCELVIAGSTEHSYFDLVVQEIKKLGLVGRVKILGYVSGMDLVALMNGAKALLFPSLTEGCPVTMLEAFGCGLPCIASNRGGLWDLGKDAAAFIEDPYDFKGMADHIRRIFNDPALLTEMKRKSLETARCFSWEKSAQEHMQTYETLYRENQARKAGSPARSTKHFKNILVAGLGVAIFAGMFFFVDAAALRDILSKANWTFVWMGVALAIVQFGIGTYRWDAFLRYKKIFVPFREVLSSLMVGSFISNFLPSKYAGDIYRVVTVTSHSGRAYDAAASVLLSRLAGLFVLALAGLLAGIYYFPILADVHLTILVTLTSLCLLGGSLLVFTNRSYRILDRVLESFRLSFLRGPVGKFHAAVADYRPDKMFLLRVFFVSLLLYFNSVLCMSMAPLAIGRTVPLLYLAFLNPMVSLVESLPLSISGLGIREGALIYFLMKAGMNYEEAFAVSLLYLFFGLASNAVGGALFFYKHIDLKKIS